MGTPGLLVSEDASIVRAQKKPELTIKTCATSNRFFLFFTYPHACMRAQQPKNMCFKTCKSFIYTYSHVGFPASNQSKSHFWTQNVDFPILKA